jgi:glycine betaine/proline transport system substrate-binding protein
MVAAVDLDGRSVDDVVASWMKDNEARWSAWIK